MDAAAPYPTLASGNPPAGAALLPQARAFQDAARRGTLPALLSGKRFGLLCTEPASVSARLFESAARQLGAQVSHVQPDLTLDSSPREVAETARLLGRLYDGLECQGLPHALVERLARSAGIPVFDGVAQPTHDSAALALLLEPGDTHELRRRCVVQAVIVDAVS